MKRLHLRSPEHAAILRVALKRFIQLAKDQGDDDKYIDEVIKRALAIDSEELKDLLHPKSSRLRIYSA